MAKLRTVRIGAWAPARCAAVVALSLWASCCAGCASRGNIELLEAQLREREDLVRSYRNQLSAARQELTLARRELDQLRAEMARSREGEIREEQTRALAAATGLTIHSLLTGGQNRDGRPGDDVIHAVLYPSDQQGEAVKLSGALELEAFDLEGEPRSLGAWRFSSEEARELWHSGFLASGYEIELPWARPPRGAEVLLKAKLHTPDGRTFDATKVVKVDPGPSSAAAVPVPSPYGAPGTFNTGAQGAATGEVVDDAERVPRPLPLGGEGDHAAVPSMGEGSTSLKPVPQDTGAAPQASGPLRTSDNWTDATIPQIR